jgi:hypothetical protein
MRNAARAAVVRDAQEALDLRGQSLGPSEWTEVTQGKLTRT